MKLIRRIMQDRSSAGAVAVLALLLFLLQGLANGVASGSMAATALAAEDIICSAHMPEGGSAKQSPAEKLANSCCGTLCRLASASFAALLVSPTEVAGQIVPQVEITLWHWSEAKAFAPPNREQQPRAPPYAPHA
ncbi:DUF2946 family protein [Agrobacterium larrymoorei]|uniref:DUF2946 domain-containing protein n=1 Tax=Agrobacterium larrymoorei TaxID=160699 RepID=A0A4D7DMH6_9HYPH|nr:DUF2946 family protein [Agrobacterium larrymoorei]QCI97521.1 DUF2946 domain-containing protein [Agrobacterium larrymoorei]QYA07039.1 DUF2946 domain-containing protein [Agrobacterium larrymoorei]